MKHLINLVKRFKRAAIVVLALLMVVSIALSVSYYTVIVATELQMKDGSALNMISTSRQFFDGSSYLAMGDSAYLSVGKLVADTSAFSTTLLTKAIYIPGATAQDVYILTKRTAEGVSTAAGVDSCSLSYMAKADSMIAIRTLTAAATSGLKFSYARLVIR